jgi:hypothetical protein
MEYSFSHLLNTVSQEENASLFRIQEVTLRSMRESVKASAPGISVQHVAVCFPEAQLAVPHFFHSSAQLLRSVSDMQQFAVPRRLPLISDILKAGAAVATGDYLVFSNTDIALTSGFYNAAAYYLSKGHDALVINRRRIPARFLDAPYEVQVAHAGYEHIGYDCFVFRRSLLEKFYESEVCIGIPPAGNDLFYNIFTFAENPLLLTRQHMTFHVGMDLYKSWGSREYLAYNYAKWKKMLHALRPSMQIAKFPGAGLPFLVRHYKWLMNPTFDYPTMCRVDLTQLSAPRKKYPEKEMRGLKHAYLERVMPTVNFPEEQE